MRLAAYGVLSSVALLATADAVAPATGLSSGIVQGGALAILGSVIWYLLTRTFPAQTAALKDQRDAFLAYLEKRDNRTD
jgi:hypothetical protein